MTRLAPLLLLLLLPGCTNGQRCVSANGILVAMEAGEAWTTEQARRDAAEICGG